MRLDALLQAIPEARVVGHRDLEIAYLVSDSRQVKPGSLFIALRGQHANGHAFLRDAVQQGAIAVVVEESAGLTRLETEVPVVCVKDSRAALSRLAQQFYGDPSSRLCLIGVTGTNGKTTVTYLIHSILKAAGHRVGLLGTVAYDLVGEVVAPTHTTPESLTLQDLLARLVRQGAAYTVMEVSSHALALNRVEGCEFDLAVFTNLTQDHLDFHHTLEAYFESKRKLFLGLAESPRKPQSKRAIINRDDSWGRRLLESIPVPAWTYALEETADFTATDLHYRLEGLTFVAITPTGSFPVRSPLIGRHNVYNLLSAIGVAVHLGIPTDQIQQGIASLVGVPGRFERLDSGQGFSVIIDYAHTEAALDHLLRAVVRLTPGRVITVFGCGGDRDRGKRAPMGRAAARSSDVVLITSDNPRHEDAMDIIKEIEVGVREGAARKSRGVELMILPGRREAIEQALSLAQRGDSVVVAGKGHETVQIIGDQKIPFDDRKMAEDWIRRRSLGDRLRGET